MFCSTCGESNGFQDRFCFGCGTSLAVVIAGGFQAAGPLREKFAPVLASLGRRVIATILDLTACWCALNLIVMMMPMRLIDDGFARKGFAILIPIGLCCAGLTYYILFEALFGATLAKAITGIQVRRRDGEACGFRAALIRNMLRPADGFAFCLVGLVVALLSPWRQRLGDLAAGTIVIRRATRAVIQILLVLAWLALFSGTFVVHYTVPRH